jgi:hypothetical protein
MNWHSFTQAGRDDGDEGNARGSVIIHPLDGTRRPIMVWLRQRGRDASGRGPLAYRVINAGAEASRFAILRPCRRMCRQAARSPDTSEAARVDESGIFIISFWKPDQAFD